MREGGQAMREPHRAGIPAGLLGMLALVFALDVAHFRRDRYSTDQAESWRFKGSWASGRVKSSEILIFGDSLAEFGVLPGVLEERTGLRTTNLAIHNGH